jgi:vitamin-K-epoxide reductase (warfarin-sensitive)
MPTQSRSIFLMIAVLSVAGVIVSAVSLQRHYAKSQTSFCEIGEKFSCDIVNRSEYSTLLGIPVAGIGVIGYGVLFALSTFFRSKLETVNQLLAAAMGGLAFALYLTYVEAHVLDTWCILCVISLSFISAISLLAIGLKVRTMRA